jgi:hypothetical protein
MGTGGMPKLIACIAGLVALAAGIFGNVSPALCLQRSFVALIVGWCLGALWQALTSIPVQLRVVQASPKKRSEPSEGEDAKAA